MHIQQIYNITECTRSDKMILAHSRTCIQQIMYMKCIFLCVSESVRVQLVSYFVAIVLEYIGGVDVVLNGLRILFLFYLLFMRWFS